MRVKNLDSAALPATACEPFVRSGRVGSPTTLAVSKLVREASGTSV